jgi:prostaglandin-H2 D-isomerase / glutathione transferase
LWGVLEDTRYYNKRLKFAGSRGGDSDQASAVSTASSKTTMAKSLLYFNFPGRAWAIRACFNIAGKPVPDEFYTFPELQALKGTDKFPLGQMPTLELDDGTYVCQSGAITRYAAKLAGLYPADPMHALFVDEIIETCNEAMAKAPQTKDEELKKKLRAEYAANDLPRYYSFLKKRIGDRTYIAGNALSIADFYAYGFLKAIRSGQWDHVPTDSDAPFGFDGYLTGLEADSVFGPYKM